MMNLSPWAALFGAALLTTACQSPAPQVVDLGATTAAPSAWSTNSNEASVQQQWWLDFGDQALSSLIEEALLANPNLAAAGARVNAATASLKATSGRDDPSLTAGLNLSRRRQNFIGLPIPGSAVASSTSSAHSLGLNASWELDLWGRLEAGERAAVANVTASVADVEAAKLAVASSVARSYFALVEARGAIAIADKAVANAQESLEQVERLQYQGRSPVEAVLQARISVQGAQTAATETRMRAASMEPALAALLGRSGGPIAVTLSLLDSRPLTPAPSAGLPADLLSRRADLAALEARVYAAHAQADVAHAALYPQISLSASAGSSASGLSDLIDSDFRVWSLGANLLAPLLNGGQLEAQKDVALAHREAALLAFAATALTAFAEVETALTNEQLIHVREGEVVNLLAQINELVETAARHHRLGTGDASAVFSARASALNTQRTLLAVRALAYTNRIALITALGGGFEQNETNSPNTPEANSL